MSHLDAHWGAHPAEIPQDEDTGGTPARWEDRRILRTTASPMQVWEAWARPEHLRRWFPDDARGQAVPGEEIVHVFERFDLELPHRVLEVDPGWRLLVEGHGPDGDAFLQEVRLERERGQTVLHLVHSGVTPSGDGDDPAALDQLAAIDSGWQLALASLHQYLERHWGEDRKSFFALRPTSFEYADLQPLYRTAEGLARWLTTEGSLEGKAVHEPIQLELIDLGTLTGRLLADSGRELALSWEEKAAVLELKAFPAGPESRAVCLRGWGWGLDGEEAGRIEAALEAATDRLVAALD